MKKITSMRFNIAFTGLMLLGYSLFAQQSFHVSPVGNDTNSGTREKPLCTLDAARDKIRQARENDPLLRNYQAEIIVHGGTYELENTFELTPEDSHITIKAANGETPVVSGGKEIKGWALLKGNIPNVSDAARGKLWSAEVPKGWRMKQLIIDGEKAQRSRHPNNDDYINGGWPQIEEYGEYSDKGMRIKLGPEGVMKGVPGNGDAEATFAVRQYCSEIFVIRDVDENDGTAYRCTNNLTFAQARKKGGYGYIGNPVRIENTLIYLDEPGEWCVDTEAGRVYYWPPDGTMENKTVYGSRLPNIVSLQGYYEGSSWGGGKAAQPKSVPDDIMPPSYPDDLQDSYPTKHEAFVHHVEFDGIAFMYADRIQEDVFPADWVLREFMNPDGALSFNGVEDCKIHNCRILFAGATGITLRGHAQRVDINRNEIGFTGSDGIYLCGYGPGTLDVNKDNSITLNYIHDNSIQGYLHSACVDFYQSGNNVVADNVFARTGYAAILYAGPLYMDLNKKNDLGSMHNMNGKYGQLYNIRWNEMPEGEFDRWYNSTESSELTRSHTGGRWTIYNVKPYSHIKNNLIARNITINPSWWGMEGGAFYSVHAIGDGNEWNDNLIWKDGGFPESSVIALDGPHASYLAMRRNVIWIRDGHLKAFGGAPEPPAPEGQPHYQTYEDNVDVKSVAQSKPFVEKFHEIWSGIQEKGGLLVEPDIAVPGIQKVMMELVQPEKPAFTDEANVEVYAIGPFDAIYYTLDGSTPTPSAKEYKKPFTVNRSLTLRVQAYQNGKPVGREIVKKLDRLEPGASSIATLEPSVTEGATLLPGLNYGFHQGEEAIVGEQWTLLRAVENMDPIETGTVGKPSLSPLKNRTMCGLSFNGFLEIKKDGLYTFYLNSDDGSRLILADKVLIDNDGERNAPKIISANIQLKKGFYPVKILYFRHDGPGMLDLQWEGPGIKKSEIPEARWKREN